MLLSCGGEQFSLFTSLKMHGGRPIHVWAQGEDGLFEEL